MARARRAGVKTILAISTRLSTFQTVLDFTDRTPSAFCTVGVHPHNAGDELAGCSVERLVDLTANLRVAGLGETGLDFHYDHSPREEQVESFRRHLQACKITGLPAVVHSRGADAETMAILREEGAGRGVTGVIHCFSGTQAMADEAVGLGLYLSLSGIITFKKAEALRTVVASVPLDQLLVETDSPYLAPVPHRGQRNEPAFVIHVAEMLARIKGVSFEELALRTTANFHRLFSRAR